MKTPEEEIALLEQAGLVEAVQTPLLESEFDEMFEALPDEFQDIYFPINPRITEEE
jgi:hypothetical protein